MTIKLSAALIEAAQFLEAFEGDPNGKIVTVPQPTSVFVECENDRAEHFTCVSLVFVGNELLISVK